MGRKYGGIRAVISEKAQKQQQQQQNNCHSPKSMESFTEILLFPRHMTK